MNRLAQKLIFLVLMISVLLATSTLADTLETTERRITSSTAYETTPTLGNDGTTDLVVYTVRPMLPNSNLGPGDILYQPLVGGAPSGSPVRVTSDSTLDEQLNDNWGDFIVYTAYDSTTSNSGCIMLYQISTGDTHELGCASIIQEPKILLSSMGNRVVWREGGAFAAMIMEYPLSYLGIGKSASPIAGPVPPTFDLEVGSSLIVWSEYSDGQFDVFYYPLGSILASPINLTNTPNVNERQPATSGDWIVWQQLEGASSTIEAQNMKTMEKKTVSYGDSNFNPSIDGDLVTWESFAPVVEWLDPVILDFNVNANGDSIEAGAIASDQWADMGVDVECSNNNSAHPDKCIVLDSYNPPMGQNDLGTNCQGNILVVAQNDVDDDGNGLVDSPYAEEGGGQIRLTFDEPVDISKIRVVDIDADEGGSAAMVVTDAGGGTIVVPIPVLGNGVVQDVSIDVPYAIELTVSFVRSGALASVHYTPTAIPQVAGATDPDLNIWVHRLSTGRNYTVTTDTADQYLNDVFGDMVAYVDYKNGSEDVYVSSLSLNPVADAGSNQYVDVGQTVVLDGSNSRDNLLSPFDNIEEINYEWCLEMPFASEAVLQGADTALPSFTPDVGGLYMAILSVTRQNDGVKSYPDNVRIYASCDALGGDSDRDSICDNNDFPDIAIDPENYDFGDVELNSSSSMLFTIHNNGTDPLAVTGLTIDPAVDGSFTITQSLDLPFEIPPQQFTEVEVTFSPDSEGLKENSLIIDSDDPDEGSIVVSLSGIGVYVEPPPDEQIQGILEFIDTSVTGGTLSGSGNGNSADNRLKAFKNMIEALDDLIASGDIEEACGKIQSILKRCDGIPKPPDFVEGEKQEELSSLIQILEAAIGCN